MSAQRGFTLIELMVTVTIIALLASVVVPMAQITAQREKERELKLALREIRGALDDYKRASEEGRIYKKHDASGYPESLDVLVEGVPDLKDIKGRKLYFIRRIPRDPFFSESGRSASDTWGKRSYASEADNPREGDDVYDVFSRSRKVGLNGIRYSEW